MPGEEIIIPVGKAVIGAAQSAFVEDKATKKQLAEISKDSDAMKSAGKVMPAGWRSGRQSC
jgi:hypothetical protein